LGSHPFCHILTCVLCVNCFITKTEFDVYISTVLQSEDIKYLFHMSVAPVNIAKLFSVKSFAEAIYTLFGGHSPCNFAHGLRHRCPEALQACVLLKKVERKTIEP